MARKVIKSASITSEARNNINANFVELYSNLGVVGVTASAAELNVLDNVTAGTVTASKGVVVDANKDIGDFRNVDVVNLDVGASGTAGTIDVFPATTSRGKLTIAVGDQTGNTTVNLSVLAMGQATTVAIPDPGAASGYVVMTSAALSLAEADVLQDVTPGTVSNSKAVVAGAAGNIGVAKVTQLHIGSSGAETQVTATAAELNKLASMGATTAELNFAADVSAQTESITSGAAVSTLIKTTDIDNTVGGAGAITLGTPNAIMAGQIKTIRMTVDNGDVTMALTNVNNVAGASAGTTCTFDAVGDTLILAACGAKWVVIGISGAAIT